MIIKNLFARQINRPINGVIKADQDDGETVWQELDEYVITKELDTHFRKFFEAYLNALDNPRDPDISSKNGVWVSGFFGSGKSHFLKVLSYLLQNDVHVLNDQSKTAVDFFDGKIQDAMLASDIKRATAASADVVLFNIDSKADAGEGRDAILRVFMTVFNEKLGYCGDHPHIAHMERHLDKEGRFNAFKEAFISVTGKHWTNERDSYHFFTDELVESLSVAREQSLGAAKEWLDRSEEAFTLTVEHFAEWVKDYLDTQSEDHRIMFMVDEVGQFIGQDTHLMLNLQTITENLGTICQGRAWVVVTSQEDIDAVIGEVRSSQANDFSKIQGRFKTRLSLSSSNVDEVIQKRLLAKTENAQKTLVDLYNDNADILRNQLSFKDIGMTFRAFADANNFADVYPFAPYQFQLVQKIFEAIRRHGVTGLHLARGERSMLDAFQIAANSISNNEVGILSPLYGFYPAIESFLEGIVKSTIDNASNNLKLEEFDVKALKTLFLIRYVDEIKGNVDNLVTLFVDRIDADRMAIRQNVEDSLQRLESETLISRNGEDFFFLTNEERDVSREIKALDLNAGDTSKLLSELVFSEVLKDQNKHTYSVNGKNFNINRVADGHPYGNQKDGGLTLSIVSPLDDDYAMYERGRCVLQSNQNDGHILIKLDDDSTLERELRAYVQTDKYVTRKNDGTLGQSTLKILRERQEENRQRRDRLITQLSGLMQRAKYFAAGQEITPKASTAPSAIGEAVEYLIKNTFSKLGFIDHRSANVREEINAVLAASDVDSLGFDLDSGKGNQKAIDDVLQHIDLMNSTNQQVVLHTLAEERYGRRPYGWDEWETILLVARLLKRGDISLFVEGATIPASNAGETLLHTSKWRTALLVKRKSIGSDELKAAQKVAKKVFGKIAPEKEDAFFSFVKNELSAWNTRCAGYRSLADTGKYPGTKTIGDATKTVKRIIAEDESYNLITAFLNNKNELLEAAEDLNELNHFYKNQKPAWDKLHKAYDQYRPNEQWLVQDVGAKTALARVSEILNAEAPYEMVKEADGLIDTIENVNEEQTSKAASFAEKAFHKAIERITSELDNIKAPDDLRNQCLFPIQQLKKQIAIEKSLAHIFQSSRNAKDLEDQAIAAIERHQAASDKPGTPPGKSRKVVRAADYSETTYLETPEQVEAYLSALREELLAAINDNKRVEIR